ERLPSAIDVQHFDAQMQLHAVVGVPGGIAQRQAVGVASAEVFGKMDPIIGALAFFAEHMNLVALQRATRNQLLDAVMADHAVADDDQIFHAPTSFQALSCCESKKKAPEAVEQLQAPLPESCLSGLPWRRCRALPTLHRSGRVIVSDQGAPAAGTAGTLQFVCQSSFEAHDRARGSVNTGHLHHGPPSDPFVLPRQQAAGRTETVQADEATSPFQGIRAAVRDDKTDPERYLALAKAPLDQQTGHN